MLPKRSACTTLSHRSKKPRMRSFFMLVFLGTAGATTRVGGLTLEKIKFQLGNFFCFFLRFHFSASPSRFATSSCSDHESQAGPLNVRRRMRLGNHCRAPPLAQRGHRALSISKPGSSHTATHNFTERGSAACFRPWWPYTSDPGTSEEVV